MKLIHRERERENLGGARRRRRRRGRGRFQGLVGSPAIRHRIHHHSLHLCQSQPLFFFFAGIFILFLFIFLTLYSLLFSFRFFLGNKQEAEKRREQKRRTKRGIKTVPPVISGSIFRQYYLAPLRLFFFFFFFNLFIEVYSFAYLKGHRTIQTFFLTQNFI